MGQKPFQAALHVNVQVRRQVVEESFGSWIDGRKPLAKVMDDCRRQVLLSVRVCQGAVKLAGFAEDLSSDKRERHQYADHCYKDRRERSKRFAIAEFAEQEPI